MRDHDEHREAYGDKLLPGFSFPQNRSAKERQSYREVIIEEPQVECPSIRKKRDHRREKPRSAAAWRRSPAQKFPRRK